MDRVIYIAMTGAREVTRQQAAVTHNLANVATHGFRQELNVFRALPVVGEGDIDAPAPFTTAAGHRSRKHK